MVFRYVNIALELFCLLICLVLLLYQFTERISKNKLNIWFSPMILSNMAMLMGELFNWIWGGQPGRAIYILQNVISIWVYFLASGCLLFSLFGWIRACIQQKVEVSRWWMYVAYGLLILQVLFVCTLPLTKLCYIDENNVYTRNTGFPLIHVPCYLLFGMAMLILFCYRRSFKSREKVYLYFFLFLPLFAQITQLLTYVISALNIAVTLSLIVVLTFIQTQREKEHEQQIQDMMAERNKKLQQIQIFQENFSDQLIDVVCSTVEAKDQYTRGHSLRVAQYVREIMYRLGGDEKAQQEAYYIGILHDVGKLRIKDEIINKKGKLTKEEYEQIKLHTVAGYQILKDVTMIPDLAVGARWHHERYDGSGYPNGLEGENIPLIARIISVADAYDAMTSNRSYHKTMSQSVVREEIKKGMGTQFDPKIAQIMLDMIDEDMQYEMKQTHFNRTIRILLIDDDKICHKQVCNALLDENYILDSAYGGKEGIEMLSESSYDLCLLDMEMPDMNGFEVLEWIQRNVRRMKVIFLTGDKDIKTIERSEALGASDYITKPVNITVLRESIKSILLHNRM